MLKLLNTLVFGNIYIAFAACCLIQSTKIQLGIKAPLTSYTLMVFFSTIFIYNVQRLLYHENNTIALSVRRRWIISNKVTVRVLTLMGLVGTITSLLFNDLEVVYYLLPLLLLSLSYFIPFINLRKFPIFKITTLALVWTVATSLIPAIISNEEKLNLSLFLHLIVRLLFMLGICLPFDVRDSVIDQEEKIKTVTHLFGENKVIKLATTIMFIYMIMIGFECYFKMFTYSTFVALELSAVVNAVLVSLANSRSNEYFYAVGIDGAMILQGLFIMISTCS